MTDDQRRILIAGGGPVGLLCAWLIGRHGLPVRVFDNNSTLRWKAGPGTPSAPHFDIVWRDTSAPDWQFHQPVSAADAAKGSITLPVSKDNVIFGVRACNPAGQCSPAVAPLPER